MSFLPPAVGKQLTRVPGEGEEKAAYAPAFHSLEWAALINRAQAVLKAIRACRAEGGPAGFCRDCPLAGARLEPDRAAHRFPCRTRFRATQQRLTELAERGPASQRRQLRRTVDSLHLAYCQTREEGDQNG